MKIKSVYPIPTKVKEEDQFFMVGDYNVNLYMDTNHDSGKEYHLLTIEKFNDNDCIDKKSLYVLKHNDNAYCVAWAALHDEGLLDDLITRRNYTRLIIDGQTVLFFH